jgi:hypothetical protein
MDPNTTLAELRSAVNAMHRLADERGTVPLSAALAAGAAVADMADALDVWLTAGGFLPPAWNANRTTTNHAAAAAPSTEENTMSDDTNGTNNNEVLKAALASAAAALHGKPGGDYTADLAAVAYSLAGRNTSLKAAYRQQSELLNGARSRTDDMHVRLVQQERDHRTTLNAIRDAVIEKYESGGSVCREGMDSFLEEHGMEPYITQVRVNYTISGYYIVNSNDLDNVRRDAERNLCSDTSGISNLEQVDDDEDVSVEVSAEDQE